MQMTPIYFLNEFGGNAFFIKREDMIPFSFGGNKARKAYYFFEDMKKGDYDCVVTYGTSSSNHTRIISNYCSAYKKECYVISPEEKSKPTYNSKLVEAFGTKMIRVPIKEVHDKIESLMAELRAAGKKPYFIQGGGHGDLGTQAYVDAYLEIKVYEQEREKKFDYIFHASGTGTTQAGLVCGKILHGDDFRTIVGISIARKNPYGRNVVMDSVRSFLRGRATEKMIQDATIFVDDYIADGYGTDNELIQKLVSSIMYDYGIPFEKTYTGKACLGMFKYLHEHNITGKKVLFIHTGGTPLFFDSLIKKGVEDDFINLGLWDEE